MFASRPPAPATTICPASAAASPPDRWKSSSHHEFLILEEDGVLLIIDPTYKQFFARDPGGPDLFIGTRAKLDEVFQVNRDLIVEEAFHTRSDYDGFRIGSYSPPKFIDKIYGFNSLNTTVRIIVKKFNYAHLRHVEYEPESLTAAEYDEMREVYYIERPVLAY